MNKKQKIIVSITGIFLVLLIIVGLTYAYFLTQITGNTNSKSISLTTADLRLTYGDGNGILQVSNKLKPGDDIKFYRVDSNGNVILQNGNPIEETTKTFTVTNTGNTTVEDYAVILEDFAIKYVSGEKAGEVTNFVNGEDGEPDMKLVITCKSYNTTDYNTNGMNATETGTCDGLDGYLPEKSDILVTNSIDEGITHAYSATFTYLDDDTDQSDDMNKTITGRFNIIDTKNTVDITGTVEPYTKGDIVTINSEYKESVIYPDGTYKLMGVKPDIHTIKIVGGNTTEIGKFSIKIGEEANTTGTTLNNGSTIPEITITNLSTILTINLKGNLEITGIEEIELPNTNTLAYNIINNIQNGDLVGKTTFVENLSATGLGNNNPSSSDKILSTAEDDYTASTGKPSYYFRGAPIDNYVNFAGMCWRVVRIQGDGSVKLILASELPCSTTNLTGSRGADSGLATDGARGVKGTLLTASYGGSSMHNYIHSTSSSSARTQLNLWLDRKITEEEQQEYLKDESWCLGDLTYAYSSDSAGVKVGTISEMTSSGYFQYEHGNRYLLTKTPSYICKTTGKEEEIDTNKVGMLTIDEVVYAGSSSGSYLAKNTDANSQYPDAWLTLSLSHYDSIDGGDVLFNVGRTGGIGVVGISYSNHGLRPSITLKSTVEIELDGKGTMNKPYVIK